MAYKIDYLDAKGFIGSDICNGPLSKAQAIAEKAITDKMADAVEIRDEAGHLILRRARTLSRA